MKRDVHSKDSKAMTSMWFSYKKHPSN